MNEEEEEAIKNFPIENSNNGNPHFQVVTIEGSIPRVPIQGNTGVTSQMLTERSIIRNDLRTVDVVQNPFSSVDASQGVSPINKQVTLSPTLDKGLIGEVPPCSIHSPLPISPPADSPPDFLPDSHANSSHPRSSLSPHTSSRPLIILQTKHSPRYSTGKYIYIYIYKDREIANEELEIQCKHCKKKFLSPIQERKLNAALCCCGVICLPCCLGWISLLFCRETVKCCPYCQQPLDGKSYW